MNATLETIRTRFSCRKYTQQMLSDEQLHAITLAAIQAPSSTNRQGWRVIVVKNQELIHEMEAESMRVVAAMEDKTLYNFMMDSGGALFYHAPCMIVIAIDTANTAKAQLDCGIVAENIALAASSLGLGNVICGLAALAFIGEKAKYFKEKLGFPEGYKFGMSVLLGYAQEKASPHEPDTSKISYIE